MCVVGIIESIMPYTVLNIVLPPLPPTQNRFFVPHWPPYKLTLTHSKDITSIQKLWFPPGQMVPYLHPRQGM